MPSEPLTPEQLEDAARLKEAWLRAKTRDPSLTQTRVAELTDLGGQSNVGHYINGRNALNVKALALFAKVFDVNPYEISPNLAKELGVYSKTINTEERAPYSGATGERRHGSRRASDDVPGAIPLRRVPIISWVRAGEFCEAVDPFEPGDADAWVDVPQKVGPNTYGLRVEGDSMEPKFSEGCVLIVDPSREPVSGSYVIAKQDGECTFKQFIKDGPDWYLKPLNDRYPVKPFREEMSICGVVVMSLQEWI